MDLRHDEAAPHRAAVAASTCRLRLLGEFAVELDHADFGASAWRRMHARRLIQLLGSSARLQEPRHTVLQALWPDFDEARARNRLHHTVHWVRQALEALPAAARPQITVSAERVELSLPPGVSIDGLEFEQLLAADVPDAAQRLALVVRALGLYRGDLAPEWQGCPDMDARRTWLAQRREKAVQEAVALARELGQVETALRYAHERALLLHDDSAAHSEYALLLHDAGRPDAALFHCKSVRAQVERGDAQAVEQIDATMRLIQQQANRAGAAARTPAEPAPPAVALVTRLCVPAPRQALRGGEGLLRAGVLQLEDPYTCVLTVLGPPGSGKSLLACWVAQRAQAGFQHGCVRVDAQAFTTPAQLLAELAAALAPLCAGLAARGACAGLDDDAGDEAANESANEAAVTACLRGKELLVVLDGMGAGSAMAQTVARLAAVNADVRWLVTAWAPLRVVGERTLRIEPLRLLDSGEPGAATAAVQILADWGALGWPSGDRRALLSIERIADAVDGLPRALQLAATHLGWMSPNELLARLARDPAALLRGAPAEGFVCDLLRWLDAAPAPVHQLLAVLGQCRSWLCRQDLATLVQDLDAEALDAVLEHGVLHHHLLRRVRNRAGPYGATSEFRVPRIVSAALAYRGDGSAEARARACIEHWVDTGPDASAAFGAAADAGFGANGDAGAAWFDDRADDVDDTVKRWLAAGRVERLQAFCARHAARWAMTRFPQRVLGWLAPAMETLDQWPPATAARLLVERARLHLRTGDPRRACADARQALAWLGGDASSSVRREALVLLQRHSTQPDAALPQPTARLCAKGIDAGENLLRVAQLAVRHGRLAQALAVCDQCIEVFAHFGVSQGLTRAHLYRARIAFAIGNTGLAQQCLAQALQASPQAGDAARAELMRADIDLHELRFAQAIERAAQVMAQVEHARVPLLVARALQITAWAHYGQGALPLATALCGAIREHAVQASKVSLVVNADVLCALANARHGQPAAALQRIASAVDLMASGDPPSDIQNDLVVAAELSTLLDRPDLSARMAQALQAFANQPGHSLRPWVKQRAAAVCAPAKEAVHDAGHGHPAPVPEPLPALPSTVVMPRGAAAEALRHLVGH